MTAEGMPLLLRGRTLMMGTGGTDEGDSSLWRLAAGGHVCRELIPPPGAPADHDFSLRAAWLTGRRVSWWMESSFDSLAVPPAGNLILGTRLGRGCAAAAATASYAPVYGIPIAVDGSSLYYAVGRTLYRRDISAGPSTAPPPNDDFAHAQEIGGALPLTVGARVGYATRLATDPAITGPSEDGSPATATRTLWYSYRPTASQVQLIIVDQWEWLGGGLPRGAFAVYQDGPGGRLTELPQLTGNDRQFVAFRADSAHRYWIGVGCATTDACFPSFTITITTEPPY
jgi:hypothetical protein